MWTSTKRKEGNAEIAQAGEGGSLSSKVSMPETADGSLDLGLELHFGWRGYQDLEWVREGVLVGGQAEAGEPRVGDRVVQHIHPMLIEGVVWSKQAHHVEQCELVLMEQSQGWERAREQVYSWGWGAGMESLKSLESGAVVEGENLKFL